MSEQYGRDTENRRSLDLENQRRNEVSSSETGQAPQTNDNTSGYVKLATGAGAAFLAIFAIFIFGITFIPSVYFLIPAAILIGLGVRHLNSQRHQNLLPVKNNQERELLTAIRDNGGSITPAETAIETSLSVREADEMLSELASGGHLQLEGRDGALYYSLPGKRTELGS